MLNELKQLNLQPDHPYGFSGQALAEQLSMPELEKLEEWMYGQTMMLDEKLGPIAYTHDVIRGVRLIRFGTPTYWD